jgi:hypothetical protein
MPKLVSRPEAPFRTYGERALAWLTEAAMVRTATRPVAPILIAGCRPG